MPTGLSARQVLELKELEERRTKWTERITSLFHTFCKSRGYRGEYLILSYKNWRDICDAWGPHMISEVTVEKEGAKFMGLRVAIVQHGDVEADIVEVR